MTVSTLWASISFWSNRRFFQSWSHTSLGVGVRIM